MKHELTYLEIKTKKGLFLIVAHIMINVKGLYSAQTILSGGYDMEGKKVVSKAILDAEVKTLKDTLKILNVDLTDFDSLAENLF